MPLIIDANRANDFGQQMLAHSVEIVRRTKARSIKIVVGGKLTVELSRTLIRPLLVEWLRSGVAVTIDGETLALELAAIEAIGYRSDDPHVIALVRASDARLVYTDDQDLINDIKDRALVLPPAKAMKSSTPRRKASALLDGCCC